MTLKTPPPSHEVPEVILRSWLVFRTDKGEDHLVGFDISEQEGRVSSQILSFDKIKMEVKTLSGRTYLLLGPSYPSVEALKVWSEWQIKNKVDSYNDVTKGYR